ncbi:MAG TPA: hypothetical protein VII69_06490 [Candidatus Eremiobacteraceae bacterium]
MFMILQSAVVAAAVLLAPTPEPSPIPSDMHSLLAYGKGWMFGAHEPDGWTGYTEHSDEIGSNVYFLPIGQKFGQDGVIIRVSILPKDFGDDVGRDLTTDMARYKTATPDIKFSDFSAEYPGGTVYAKIYGLKRADEYVSYVNPGHTIDYYFIVSLDPPPKQRASDSDIAAYRAVIKTLTFLGQPKH